MRWVRATRRMLEGTAGKLVILVTSGAVALALAACGGGPPERAASRAADADDQQSAARAQSDDRIRFLEQRAAADPLDVFGLNALAFEHLQRARETGDVGELTLSAGALERSLRIRFLERRAAADPLDVFGLNALAFEHLQRARETGDVGELTLSAAALERSLRVRTDDNYEAHALSASLAITRHDFADAVSAAQRAIAQKPGAAYAYGALGDAYLGLGRYDDAAVAYERMYAIERDLGALSRKALLAQLYGRHAEAEELWLAALEHAEGDGVPEHAAWIHVQMAHLDFNDGRIEDAGEHYRRALGALPEYVHGLAGMGRVAAARGEYDEAWSYYSRALERVPLPEYAAALGDVYAAAGQAEKAAAEYALVDAIEQLYDANGVDLDLQIALFSADHGRVSDETVERAKATFAEQPSIQAADALAWVQYNAGDIDGARTSIEQALRTGTRDNLILYHAGMIYHATGDEERARELLAVVVGSNPRFSVLHATAASDALADLEARALGHSAR